MPELTVERLSLRIGGISESEGRHLASLIADGLAGAEISGVAGNFPAMQMKVAARPGNSLPALAEQIVADLIGQLERTN
jgi:hypothetical protein